MRDLARSGETEAVATVKAYISRINARDAIGLAKISGSHLRFIDALGRGCTRGREGWEGYFSDFPDYRVRADEIISSGGSVAVFGFACGSFKGRGSSIPGAAWRVPAIWPAKVGAGKLVEWQVYRDVGPLLQSAGLSRSSRRRDRSSAVSSSGRTGSVGIRPKENGTKADRDLACQDRFGSPELCRIDGKLELQGYCGSFDAVPKLLGEQMEGSRSTGRRNEP
jgi:hypothetical protein